MDASARQSLATCVPRRSLGTSFIPPLRASPMTRTCSLLAVALLATAVPAADYKIKIVEKSEPPGELKDAVRGLIGDQAIQFLDGDKLLAEIWFRKAIPAKATEA